ncbi:hypothetical protein BDV39DRAFT_207539 [Aspergillus sergii]|uniref:DUF829-domain-containing protein n=1 Tax=Aspergillus sergii TaxID=1034303 RepID=A0A5N6WV95_9EURO|nr:hypothetical protein BDV39DRAFT_207539 [Aspergillus sergii]
MDRPSIDFADLKKVPNTAPAQQQLRAQHSSFSVHGLAELHPNGFKKYVAGYRSLYPDSAILLITTRILELAALPFSVLHSRVAPARDYIRRKIAGKKEADSIILHIFSHGGCNTAIQLALSLRQDSAHSPLELGPYLRGVIFDCCPGDTSFSRAYQAAAVSLPSQSMPSQALGKLLLYPAIGLITGLQRTGLMSSVSQLRSELNDSAVFGASAKRLYLYSTVDQMVRWEGVESHLAAAKARLGCSTEGVAFTDSPHYAIVRDHADRYWDTIDRFWAGREVSTPAAMTSGQLGGGLSDRFRSPI